MPIVAHSALPTFERLRERGQEVLPLEHALKQDIRELHIGLLNMMPDAALQVTEQQFMRLVGSSNQIAQFFVHPFSVPGLHRSPESQAYIDLYYSTFQNAQEKGLDALIITGANVSSPALEKEPFWGPLSEVMAWAAENVSSVLCSCLATHALLQQFHGIERQPLGFKRWGVFDHRVLHPYHPLLSDINTRFDVPHSRFNEISREQFIAAGLSILVESEEAGVHMAVSQDHFRVIYFQGHPEYDINSLLKEYKREVHRYFHGEREDYPPHPDNYFSPQVAAVATAYREMVQVAKRRGSVPPPFPENAMLPQLDNTWGDTARAIFNNWLGLVYRVTDLDRRKLFKEGIDPNDPLGLHSSNGGYQGST